MEKSNDYLEEFERSEKKPGGIAYFIERIDFIFFAYITGLIIYKYFYLNDPLGATLLYQVIFMIMLPFLFWFLFIKGYKTGWFLRSLYYSFFVIVLGISLLNQHSLDFSQSLLFIFIALSTITVVSGFYKQTLHKLKIGWKLILAYIIIVLALFIFFFKFNYLEK